MSSAVALMLEGMPSPWDLHLHRAAGRVVVLVGSKLVAVHPRLAAAASSCISPPRKLSWPG